MRIIVTGSRDWQYVAVVFAELSRATYDARLRGEPVTVVHGDCDTGADQAARLWVGTHCPDLPITEEPHPARWYSYGHSAGPIRNQHMIDLGADLVLGFSLNYSAGTEDCIRRARTAGLPVKVVRLAVESNGSR